MSQAARELFRRAEPLLRLKRKGGWSSDEAWATLVEHWLLDVGEQISTPMPKRRQLRQKQISRWRQQAPDVIDMMHGISSEEQPAVVAMLRTLATASGRRELLDGVAAQDAVANQQQQSHAQQAAQDAADDSMSHSDPSNYAAGSVEWSRCTSCRDSWMQLVRTCLHAARSLNTSLTTHANDVRVQVPSIMRDYGEHTVDELLQALLLLPASTWSIADSLKCMHWRCSHAPCTRSHASLLESHRSQCWRSYILESSPCVRS